MIGDALRTYLLTKTGLTDLVSTRIYRGTAPQTGATTPYVVYRQLGREARHYSGSATGNPVSYFELSCYADTTREAELVFEQVRLAIDGYRGTLSGSDYATRCIISGVEDIDPNPAQGDEKGHRGIVCDLDIAHTETVTAF